MAPVHAAHGARRRRGVSASPASRAALPAVLLSGGETTVTVRGTGAAGATPNSCWRWRWRSKASRRSTPSPATPTGSTAPRTMPARSAAPTALRAPPRAILDLERAARRQRRLRRLRRARRSGRHRPDPHQCQRFPRHPGARTHDHRIRRKMRRQRSAKIVATLGPASATPEQIAALFEAGVDVFRLNFSHGKQERPPRALDAIRALEKEDRPADRHHGRSAGAEAARRHLRRRQGDARHRARHFRLDLDKAPGDAKRAPLPHPEIFAALEPGHRAAARRRQHAPQGREAAARISPRPRS